MDLSRGGGPGDRPPLDPEQQRQLELQQQLEREQRITEQTPQVMAQLGKELDQHPTLGPQLKQYSREQQDEIKKALTEGITQRIGRNGLQRIDGIAPTKDGGIMINFNEFRVVYLKGDQLPTLADGSRPVKIVEPVRSAAPEHQSAQQRETEPATRSPQQESDRAPSSQRGRETVEPQRPAQERTLPVNGEYTSLNNLAQRQQQAWQGTPLNDRHVAKPHFENGILVVEPIPYTNPFSPQPISHEPQQRQADIQTLLEPKLGNALDSYNPAQQNQLKQALTEEISDITGSSLKIDHIQKLDDGRLSIQLNQGLHQIYLDPREVLQPPADRQASPTREPLSLEEQLRRESQQQIQQQLEQLSQHLPFEKLIMESRLREAVGDERIESMRLEGEDTIQLGLRNGLVLTATTHELLNMADGRELLNRSQVDPNTQSNSTDQSAEEHEHAIGQSPDVFHTELTDHSADINNPDYMTAGPVAPRGLKNVAPWRTGLRFPGKMTMDELALQTALDYCRPGDECNQLATYVIAQRDEIKAQIRAAEPKYLNRMRPEQAQQVIALSKQGIAELDQQLDRWNYFARQLSYEPKFGEAGMWRVSDSIGEFVMTGGLGGLEKKVVIAGVAGWTAKSALTRGAAVVDRILTRVGQSLGKDSLQGGARRIGSLEAVGVAVIDRQGSRMVMDQQLVSGIGEVACGPTAAAMIMGDRRMPVNIVHLAKAAKIGEKGTTVANLTKAMQQNGISAAQARGGLTVSDLVAATSKGDAAIAQIEVGNSFHYVVVDGVTSRPGLSTGQLVAVRDPWNATQYFVPVKEFNQKFTGWGILTNTTR